MSLKIGSTGSEVKTVQKALIRLGYGLTKYGPDGDLGKETWKALEQAAIDYGVADVGEEGLDTDEEVDAVVAAVLAKDAEYNTSDDTEVRVISCLANTSRNWKGKRDWSAIDSIVIHQTGCTMGAAPARWSGVPIHVGIPMNSNTPTVFMLAPFEQMTWHANGFNKRSIGIEIDGNFPGICNLKREASESGALRKDDHCVAATTWSGGGTPAELLAAQVTACRYAIRKIVEVVAANGGQIKYIFAHRQSSKDRVADPGQEIWMLIGEWAKSELGLSDGGEGFVNGSGLTLPDLWTGESRGVTYYTWGDDSLQPRGPSATSGTTEG